MKTCIRPQHRRRDGMIWLVAGGFTLGAAFLVSAATTDWRRLLYTTPVFTLSVAMRPFLLAQPPEHSRLTSEHLKRFL